ncbi:unnamed protein product [Alopecurus aequalis]
MQVLSSPRAGGGPGDTGEFNLCAEAELTDVGGEGVVAEEHLDEQKPPGEHDEVLSGALLVVGCGALSLPPIGPVHVLQQLASFLPYEPVADELLGRGAEHPGVPGGAWLVPEQQLALLDGEQRPVVALDVHVGLCAPELVLHGRVQPQHLPHGRLGELHLFKRRQGHLPAGVRHGGSYLRRQPPVERLAGLGDEREDPGEEQLQAAIAVEHGGEDKVVACLFARQPVALGGVERVGGGDGEEFVERLVVAVCEEGGQGHGVQEQLLEDHGEPERDEGPALQQEPLGGLLGAGGAEGGRGGEHAEVGVDDELEGGDVAEGVEVGLAAEHELRLDGGEERGELGAEGRDEGVLA